MIHEGYSQKDVGEGPTSLQVQSPTAPSAAVARLGHGDDGKRGERTSEGMTESAGDMQDTICAVEVLIAQASEMPLTVASVRTLLRTGIERELSPGDMSLLEWHIAEATDWSSHVVATMSKDERNRCNGHCISDLDKAASAFGDQLELDHHAVWTDGQMYVYPKASGDDPVNNDADSHRFTIVTDEELDGAILEFFRGISTVRSARDRKEVVSRLQARFTAPGFFDDAPPGVNLENGFLTWAEGSRELELLAHDPNLKSRTLLPTSFDRAAAAPVFLAGLERMLPDQSRRDAVQETFGAILFGVCPEADRERRIFVLHGAPGSGKSTLIALLELLTGGDAVSVPPQTWGNERSRARLVGVLLNVCTELDSGKPLPPNFTKQIASCEMITGRHPHGREFQFRPRAWHVFSGNGLPRIDDATPAIGRRFLAIGFDRSLDRSEVEGDFLLKVQAELPGILNWAAVGAARLIAEGRFTLPHGHNEALLEMQHGDDPLVRYIHERVERAPGERLLSSALQQDLRDFARLNEVDSLAMIGSGTMKRASRLLNQVHGGVRGPSNSRPEYLGVRLRSWPSDARHRLANCPPEFPDRRAVQNARSQVPASQVDLVNM